MISNIDVNGYTELYHDGYFTDKMFLAAYASCTDKEGKRLFRNAFNVSFNSRDFQPFGTHKDIDTIVSETPEETLIITQNLINELLEYEKKRELRYREYDPDYEPITYNCNENLHCDY